MPSRTKSGPGECAKCNKFYNDLLEHITKRHQYDRFHQDEVADAGLVVCVCGRVVRNLAGLMKHQSRYGCLVTDRPTQTIQHQAVTAPTTCSSALTPLSSTLTTLSEHLEASQSLAATAPHRLPTTSTASSSLPTLTPSPAQSRSSHTLGAQTRVDHRLIATQTETWGSSPHSSLHPGLPIPDNHSSSQAFNSPLLPFTGLDLGWGKSRIPTPASQSREDSPEVGSLRSLSRTSDPANRDQEEEEEWETDPHQHCPASSTQNLFSPPSISSPALTTHSQQTSRYRSMSLDALHIEDGVTVDEDTVTVVGDTVTVDVDVVMDGYGDTDSMESLVESNSVNTEVSLEHFSVAWSLSCC